MADEPASTEDRLDRLEEKLDQLLSVSHGQAEQTTEQRLNRPSTIQEQVRAELARAEAERQASADADADKSERESIREQLAKLQETPPAQPQPRRQRIMWGPR